MSKSTNELPPIQQDFLVEMVIEKSLTAQVVELALLGEITSNDTLKRLICVLGMNRAEELSAFKSITASNHLPLPDSNSSDTRL